MPATHLNPGGGGRMNDQRKAELATLEELYGTPLRTSVEIVVGAEGVHWWNVEKTRRRDGEVVLFIRRRDGNLLLHTKDFYPERALRVPSGGIKPGEAVLDALQREVAEETGLEVQVERFLVLVEFTLRIGTVCLDYPSYSFLLRELAGELATADRDEHIAAFSEVALEDLGQVAAALKGLTGEWREWGAFRAIPHGLAAQVLTQRS